MAEASADTAVVVCLALEDFGRQPVAAQAKLRERLGALLARAIEPLAPEDRIVADTADGAAVVVLGAPTDALMLARRARRGARDADEPYGLRVGVNLGPVGVATDAAGEVVVVGDAVAAGASIAGFAQPGQLLASRAFREALAAEDPERAERLRPVGSFTDAALRAHEVYAFDPASESAIADAAPAPGRRRVVLVAATAALALLGAGAVVRRFRHDAARAQRQAAVELAITPFGEVRVDGEPKGRTPPITRLELSPGKHTVEVRHPGFAPVTLQVDLDPGEQATLRHAFGTTPQRTASAQQKSASGPRDYWRDLRRQLGF